MWVHPSRLLASHSCAGACAILLLVFLPADWATAETPASIQAAIDIAKSPDKGAQARVDAAKSLTDAWEASLPVLIQNIDWYYRTDAGQPYNEGDIQTLIPLTDLVLTILVNNYPVDDTFRKVEEGEDNKTIKLLAWGARGTDKGLRYNSAYILGNVIDNTNLCIILDHLRDPELSREGRVNLLQVAVPTASYAYKENVQDILATVRTLRPQIPGSGYPLPFLVDVLEGRAMNSLKKDVPIPRNEPGAVYCLSYKPMFPLPDASPPPQ
jgi:hypothetical protein